MKMALAALALAGFASIASAQTATDDSPSTENWWDRVGAGFFSDENMQTMRPETEIRAMWTGLSADDQAAVLARCDEMSGAGNGSSASRSEGTTGGGSTQNTGTASGADSTNTGSGNAAGRSGEGSASGTSVTGSTVGEENQTASQSGTSAETGLAPSVTGPTSGQMTQVCELLQSL